MDTVTMHLPPQEMLNEMAAESGIPAWRLRQAFVKEAMRCDSENAEDARQKFFNSPYGSETQHAYLVSWDMYSERDINRASDLDSLKKACYGAPRTQIVGRSTFEYRAIAVGVKKLVSLANDLSDLREAFPLAPTRELEDLVILRMAEMLSGR